ncbi:hypothetical protein AAEX28_09250 [Lentisphaerota bacterium WC36G]|nr:hypothetical protein LJT99_12095 [Lentisphaerae bacterium WC36]
MQRLKNFFLLLCLSIISGLLTACYTPLNVAEALQQKTNEKIYTAYNLFYTDINNIDAENIIKGNFIPYGTPVGVVKSETSSYFNHSIITFKNLKNGELFTVRMVHAKMMIPPNQILRHFLTTKTPEQINSTLTEKFIPIIEQGEVKKGMTKADVLVAYGYPPRNRTSDTTDDTWIYWNDVNSSIRFVFRNEKVAEIIDIKNY